MITYKVLYPFDPFRMYSSSFAGPIEDDRIVAILTDGTTVPVLQIGNYDEARLGELIHNYHHGANVDAFDKSSKALAIAWSECRHVHCQIWSASGPIPKDQITGLRAVRNHYQHLRYSNFGHPDQSKILGETFYSQSFDSWPSK